MHKYLVKTDRLLLLLGSKVRIATLQMTILLLKQLAVKGSESYLLDRHLAAIEQCREESTLMLRNFYKVRTEYIKHYTKLALVIQN